MNPIKNRRFTRIHERILLSPLFSFVFGAFFSVFLPWFIYRGSSEGYLFNRGQEAAIITTTLAFLCSFYVTRKLSSSFPGGRTAIFIAPYVILIYSTFSLLALLTRIELSRLLLFYSCLFSVIWLYVEYFATLKYKTLKCAVLKGGMAEEVLQLKNIDARLLTGYDLKNRRYDAVVADFDSIDDEVERFLTDCALRRIPVYDAKFVYESFSGRVRIHRMSENNIGSLLPTPFYELIKLCLDWAIVIISLPLVLFIALVTALAIRLESPGPVIYKQERIGQGGLPFTIYKFRSMRFDRDVGQYFADDNDPRITRVGKVIRKLRIDELPQFLNILKGEMSLIGPRPEQPLFVEEFKKLIPFYNYRHIVKPGITGWAQVCHGYADSADATKIKIEHDFYYIKHCSVFLDLMIIILTIKTMLTGFGAR